MDCRLQPDASKFVRSIAEAKKQLAKKQRQVIDLEKDKRNKARSHFRLPM